MKKNKKLIYIISGIFFLQTIGVPIAWKTSSATAAEATSGAAPSATTQDDQKAAQEQMMSPNEYSKIFGTSGPCAKHGNDFQKYSIEYERLDDKGEKVIKYTGKLFEKEELSGERVFDFQKMKSDYENAVKKIESIKTEVDLIQFTTELKCRADLMAMAHNEELKFVYQNANEFNCDLQAQETTEDELKKDPNLSQIQYSFGNPNEKTCDSETQKNIISKLKAAQKPTEDIDLLNAEVFEQIKKIIQQQKPSDDKTKTEGGIGCSGADCQTKNALKETQPISEDVAYEQCCNTIKLKWQELGFTNVKSSQANKEVCDELMLDDEIGDGKSGFFSKAYKQLESCVLKGLGAAGKDLLSSFKSVFDTGTWMAIWSFLGELKDAAFEAFSGDKKSESKSSFSDVLAGILASLTGWDSSMWSCMNSKNQLQYACQIIGKTFGNMAGFSAGVGLATGALKGALAAGKAVRAAKGAGVIGRASLGVKTLAVDAAKGAGKGVLSQVQTIKSISKIVRPSTYKGLGKRSVELIKLPFRTVGALGKNAADGFVTKYRTLKLDAGAKTAAQSGTQTGKDVSQSLSEIKQKIIEERAARVAAQKAAKKNNIGDGNNTQGTVSDNKAAKKNAERDLTVSKAKVLEQRAELDKLIKETEKLSKDAVANKGQSYNIYIQDELAVKQKELVNLFKKQEESVAQWKESIRKLRSEKKSVEKAEAQLKAEQGRLAKNRERLAKILVTTGAITAKTPDTSAGGTDVAADEKEKAKPSATATPAANAPKPAPTEQKKP